MLTMKDLEEVGVSEKDFLDYQSSLPFDLNLDAYPKEKAHLFVESVANYKKELAAKAAAEEEAAEEKREEQRPWWYLTPRKLFNTITRIIIFGALIACLFAAVPAIEPFLHPILQGFKALPGELAGMVPALSIIAIIGGGPIILITVIILIALLAKGLSNATRN